MASVTNASDWHHRRPVEDCAYTFLEMRSLRAIPLALVLAAWAAGTAAACLLPGAQLSEEEKACCREMAPQCGEKMQASHSCCAKSANDDQSSLASRSPGLHPELGVALLASHEGSWSLSGALIPSGAFTSPSPPGLAAGANTILRI